MVPSLLFRSPSFLAHIGYCLHWSKSSSIKNCRALSLMMKKEQTLTLNSSKVCNMWFFIWESSSINPIQSNPEGKFDFYTSKMLKTFSFNPLQKSWENHGSFSLFYYYFPFPPCNASGAKDQKLSKFQPGNSSTWIWTPSGNSYQGRVFCIEIDHWKLEFLGFWGRNCHSSLRSSRTAEGGSCTTSVVCVCVCLCVCLGRIGFVF